ncbi:MAG: phage head closure protein [Lactobacillus sp.]|jgi:SPP1 family predicted phage head-tail adaptor|nr:phage head closure protein [Lactobacillus sp.]
MAEKTWDLDIDLIAPGRSETDEFGNPVNNEKRTTVQSYEKQIQRYEFYAAAQAGIRPNKLFVIHPFEYSGEPKIQVGEDIYYIIRTYQMSNDEMELYVETKVGDRGGV